VANLRVGSIGLTDATGGDKRCGFSQHRAARCEQYTSHSDHGQFRALRHSYRGHGQGFAPHEQVAIFRQTRPFFAYETDANGSFVGTPIL
jgi:hypothetical protein